MEMDVDSTKQGTKGTGTDNVLEAILRPKTNAQLCLKVYFEIAFQNHIARWINQQAKLTHMVKYVSRAGLAMYWFKDAIRNICPKCLKKQFVEIWTRKASADEIKEMTHVIKFLLTNEFDVMELLMDKSFRKNMEDIVHCIPYPDSKYPACTC